MKTIDVQSTNSKGEAATYTSVLISELLALAGPAADATTVEFVKNLQVKGVIEIKLK